MKAKKQVVRWKDEKEVLGLLDKASQPFFGKVTIHELVNLWCYHRDLMMPMIEQACSSQSPNIRIGTALFLEREVGYFKCGMCPSEEKYWFLSCLKTLNKGASGQVRQIMRRSLNPKNFSNFGKV